MTTETEGGMVITQELASLLMVVATHTDEGRNYIIGGRQTVNTPKHVYIPQQM